MYANLIEFRRKMSLSYLDVMEFGKIMWTTIKE